MSVTDASRLYIYNLFTVVNVLSVELSADWLDLVLLIMTR